MFTMYPSPVNYMYVRDFAHVTQYLQLLDCTWSRILMTFLKIMILNCNRFSSYFIFYNSYNIYNNYNSYITYNVLQKNLLIKTGDIHAKLTKIEIDWILNDYC